MNVLVYLLLIVKAIVGMFSWTWIKVLDDVVCLSFEQMMVTVLCQEVLYFSPANVTFIFPIDSTECRVWFKWEQSA